VDDSTATMEPWRWSRGGRPRWSYLCKFKMENKSSNLCIRPILSFPLHKGEHPWLNVPSIIDQSCHVCFGPGSVPAQASWLISWREEEVTCRLTMKKVLKINTFAAHMGLETTYQLIHWLYVQAVTLPHQSRHSDEHTSPKAVHLMRWQHLKA
jgi:hypothetical protein